MNKKESIKIQMYCIILRWYQEAEYYNIQMLII